MKSGEAKTESPLPSQEAVNEHANLVLADAAIEGLENPAAGFVLDTAALDNALARVPRNKATG